MDPKKSASLARSQIRENKSSQQTPAIRYVYSLTANISVAFTTIKGKCEKYIIPDEHALPA